MVCHGKRCNVTFSEASFKHCTLVATAGACVTLHACSFTLEPEGHHGIALVATDKGTAVHLDQACTIWGGAQGCLVQAGARLTASGLLIERVSVAGVLVTGLNSSLQLTECRLRNFRTLGGVHQVPNVLNDAISVQDKAMAQLTDTRIEGVPRRVFELSLIHI